MSSRTAHYLEAMGIERWVLRRGPAGAQVPETPVPAETAPAPSGADAPESPRSEPCNPPAGPDWSELERRVAACTLCGLHASRTQTVFGVGNRGSDWMFIGEAPGAEEDARGEPFVGRAGQLLNAMIRAVGLERESVYIANILKCRPPNNRDPQPDEVAHCSAYLNRQIELVAPRVIVAVGRIAAQNLLRTDQATGRLRGRIHRLPGFDIPVVVTYHPAYLLRKPIEKRKVWQDLLLAHSVSRNGG